MKSFKDFIHYISFKEQKTELCVLILLISIIGVLFYNLYPFPFVFPDTGAYILSAQSGILNIYRPMGYSYYLQFLHSINSSFSFIFIASYFFNALISLFFLYSFKYLIELKNKWIFYGLCLFVFLSPTILFSTNFLMSDGLFNTLTILFMATALWMVYSSNIWIIIIHLCCLAMLYNVRYAGMFYVPVSMIVLFLAFQKKAIILRIIIACIPIALLLFLQNSTRAEYKKVTGVNTTSGFGGWQLMNNASVLIPKAKQLPVTKFDTELEQLYHKFLISCPDSIFTTQAALSTGLMWDQTSPFKQFVFYYMQMTNRPYPIAWVEAGELYSKYAQKLIFTYPFDFITSFIIPSFTGFFEFREIGEHGGEFKNEKMYQDYYNIQIDNYKHTCNLFSDINPARHILHYIYWIIFAAASIYFFVTTRKSSFADKYWQTSGLLLSFIIIYIGISALASPNTTWRYTMPIYIPSILFIGSILNELLIKTSLKNKIK